MLIFVLSVCGFISLCLFELRKTELIYTFLPRNVWFLAGIVFLASGWITLFRSHFYFGVFFGCSALFRIIVGGIIGLVVGIIYLRLLTGGLSIKHYFEDDKKINVLDDGLYGRCRHPGFYLFILGSVSLAICEGSFYGLIYCGWTSILNTIYIVLQDIWWFPIYIKGYKEYKQHVPFLEFWKKHK